MYPRWIIELISRKGFKNFSQGSFGSQRWKHWDVLLGTPFLLHAQVLYFHVVDDVHMFACRLLIQYYFPLNIFLSKAIGLQRHVKMGSTCHNTRLICSKLFSTYDYDCAFFWEKKEEETVFDITSVVGQVKKARHTSLSQKFFTQNCYDIELMWLVWFKFITNNRNTELWMCVDLVQGS